MSYRVAYVHFSSGRNLKAYPANLYRADLHPGDNVMVWMVRDQNLRDATIESIDYRSFNCSNSIICTKAEHKIGVECNFDAACGSKVYIPEDGSLHGLAEVYEKIEKLGWSETKSTSSTWFKAYGMDNEFEAGSILFRKNGIDLVVQRLNIPVNMTWQEKKQHQRKALNYYNNCEVDLLAHTVSFAAAFQSGYYDRATLLRSYGMALRPAKSGQPPDDRPHFGYSPPNHNLTTAEIADMSDEALGHEYGPSDIYQAISDGNGMPEYLGDGIWIGPGGQTWDD
jgi:hypothetical protein